MSGAIPQRGSWARRFFIVLDQLLNVAVLNGDEDVTISLHCAESADKGERWACWFCDFLSAMVEPGHCAKTLAGEQTPTLYATRAAVLLGFLAFCLDEGVRCLVAFIWHLL